MSYGAAGSARYRGRYYMGDISSILNSLTNDATASARAEVYAKLADFQALPLRTNAVVNQVNAYQGATPTRGIDESAQLSALQLNLSNAQAYWNQANGIVSSAISAISGGGISAIGDVASAVAAMTLSANQVSQVEQDARNLITGSQVLDDGTKQQLLALGAGPAFSLVQLAMLGAAAYVVVRLVKR